MLTTGFRWSWTPPPLFTTINNIPPPAQMFLEGRALKTDDFYTTAYMKTTFKDPDENEEDVMPTVDNDFLDTLLHDVYDVYQ